MCIPTVPAVRTDSIRSVANATADLLMMAAWDLASQSIGGDSIPVRLS